MRRLRLSSRLYHGLATTYLRFFDIDSYLLRRRLRTILDALGSKAEVTFVQVGSNDGSTNDFFYKWVVSSNCAAIFFEPVPHVFRRLVANYKSALGDKIQSRLTFVNAAISQHPGDRVFFSIDPSLVRKTKGIPSWYDQIGSLVPGHISRHLSGQLDPFVVPIPVTAVRLDEFCSSNAIETIDILHIDAEGSDDDVLLSLWPSGVRPTLIVMEHKHLTDPRRLDVLNLLSTAGYVTEEYRSDFLAIRKDHLELESVARLGRLLRWKR